ncbi:MAG: hypothetical protein AB4042_21770 [Leptolyngbyaceae cyanobacterium]
MTTTQNLTPTPLQLSPTAMPAGDNAIQSIAASLKAIATQLGTTPQLGFVQPPKTTWIYANRTQGDRWYWRTPDGNYELCPTSAIAGRLIQLEFKEVTRRQQPVWKLWATLEADRTYIIEAGRDSVFAKSLLVAIASLSPHILQQPITLEVYPADQNEESLFCNVYVEGERVFKKWGDDPDWEAIAQTAISAVTQASRDRLPLTTSPNPSIGQEEVSDAG